MRKLTVLIPCRNDETGKRYEAGDVVVEGEDFTAAQVEGFLATEPPVLTVRDDLPDLEPFDMGLSVDEEEE